MSLPANTPKGDAPKPSGLSNDERQALAESSFDVDMALVTAVQRMDETAANRNDDDLAEFAVLAAEALDSRDELTRIRAQSVVIRKLCTLAALDEVA